MMTGNGQKWHMEWEEYDTGKEQIPKTMRPRNLGGADREYLEEHFNTLENSFGPVE